MRKKNLILTIIGVLGGLFITLILWTNWGLIGLTKDIFSKNYGTEKQILSFDSERDFHGDGFSIEVFRLDKESQDYYKNPPGDFFTDYPKRHYHLGDYQIYKWTKTPQREEDTYRITFAIHPDGEYQSWIFPEDESEEIKKHLSLAANYLRTEGNYYSMFFSDHPYQVYGIDLFIISPRDGLLFKINRQ